MLLLLWREEDDTVPLYIINQKSEKDEAMVTLVINNQLPVCFKLDTGAQANIISKSIFDQLNPNQRLHPTSQRLTSYCGSKKRVVGACDLLCSHKFSKAATHKFYIADSLSIPIIGYRSSINVELIKLILIVFSSKSNIYIQDHYKTVFDGIGCLESECSIHLKKGSVPTVYPAQRILEALKSKLQQETYTERDGIIKKVTEPTDWVNSMVIIENKDGSVQLCIDSVDLNIYKRQPYYPIPTLKNATSKLHGPTDFSKLDAQFGYWSFVLSESTSCMMTFTPIYGRYSSLRMQTSIILTKDEFQRRMEETFKGLNGFIVTIIVS
ncbi:hypothetical protein QYM36_007094 [Artemia franciscana]|uniref:Polyprotein n=1 Tax=Artemia franciscana TaxID=6661 RepID=A0AA88HYV0_ARTSF|nr:hypothetical protein QYM36_007094 [Artemia franciscana]